MAGVVQWLVRLVVAQKIAGSNPVTRPLLSDWSANSCELAPVAQWIEYLASNQVVGSSNLSGRTGR